MRRLLPPAAALAVIATFTFVSWLAHEHGLDFQSMLLANVVKGLILVFAIWWVIRLVKADPRQHD